MTILDLHQKFIDDFFCAIEPLHRENKNPGSFSYLAVKQGEEFYLVQGALVFNNAPSKTPFSHFRSDNVRAGNYRLSELNLDARGVVAALLYGQLPTPDGELFFPGNESGNRGATYEPFHHEGIKTQSRFDVLTLLGGLQATYIRQPLFDWELRAAPTPYEGLQELAFEYKIGQLRSVVSVEVIALGIAAVDFTSVVSGTNAKLKVFLVHGLSTEKVTLGYRIFAQDRVESRSMIKGSAMAWTQTADFQHGTIEISVPNAAVIQCFVSYCGIAQHFGWLSDPKTMQNPKRAVYNIFDDNLEILNDFLSKSGGKGRNARDLESGIAWLLWMLGFSVAHFGGTVLMQEKAADLIATTPKGDFVVIECTTGLLKADNKLPLLIERTERVKAGVVASNNKHLRVLAAIVTSRPRAEISADIEQAEKLGVLVISRENLEQAVSKTLRLANAEQLYDEAIKSVESAKEKYETQTSLPL
jgi:hypothetical protein